MSEIKYQYIERKSRLFDWVTVKYFEAAHVKSGITVKVFCLWPPSRVIAKAMQLVAEEF